MGQTLNFNILGLSTYPNDASQVQPGSLVTALNIDLSAPGLAKPRRGFNQHSTHSSGSDRSQKLFLYSDTLWSHVNGSTLYGYISSAWASRGSITKPTNAKAIRAVPANKSLFLTSDAGLKKVDSTSNNLYSAGIPKGLHMTLAVSGSTGTAVAASKYVAYRYILGRRDAQNNIVYGGVSARGIVQNTQIDTRDITVTCYLPSGLTATEHFIQLYRTAGSTVVPNDEMQLCYEATITSTNITDGYVAIPDIVTDDLLGASLYTSPSQQGIAQDNLQPPLAEDIASFKEYLFFADITAKHKYSLTLIGCGGSSGLVVNDTITIASGATSEVYTAKASNNFTSKEFLVDVASSSISVRIDTTIRNLIDCINQKSTLVYAYLLSTGDSDLPGKIILESRTLGASAFTVASSRSTCWSPALASSPGTSQTSTNDAYKNGLMFSKYQNPEAVPGLNIFFVGSSDDRIRRIIALKDTLLIFKEKEGVFALRGSNSSSFTVELLDSTAKIVAPESAVVVNNLVYCLTESGVCEVSDNGVSIISLPIKDKINNLFSTSLLTLTKDYTFGISYETDGKFYLCTVSSDADTSSTYQLVYDVYSRKWSESNLNIRCGFVNPSDSKVYLGSGNSAAIKVERKSFDYTDHADYIQTCTVSAQNTTTLTIDGTSSMSVGDVLLQGSLEPAYITAVDTGSGTVTIDVDQTFTLSTADVTHLKAIDCQLEFARDFSGNPAGFKHYSEAIFPFKEAFIGDGVFSFSSDVNPSVNEVTISGADAADGFGYQAWGDGPWGGDSSPSPIRVGVPYSTARASALSVSFANYKAYSYFELSGMSLVFNPTSTRVGR